jgi:hypothetical protein
MSSPLCCLNRRVRIIHFPGPRMMQLMVHHSFSGELLYLGSCLCFAWWWTCGFGLSDELCVTYLGLVMDFVLPIWTWWWTCVSYLDLCLLFGVVVIYVIYIVMYVIYVRYMWHMWDICDGWDIYMWWMWYICDILFLLWWNAKNNKKGHLWSLWHSVPSAVPETLSIAGKRSQF